MPVRQKSSARRDTRSELHAQDYYIVTIDESADPSDPSRVFVGVNGVGYWMERGITHTIPKSVLGVLQEQTKTEYRKAPRSNELTPREVPPYPYRVLRQATEEEKAEAIKSAVDSTKQQAA